MPSSSAISAYSDVRAALDKALESPNGIRIKLNSKGQCINMQQRIYSFRKLDRKRSVEIFPPGHPSHNSSVYDCLTVRIEGTDVFVMMPPPLEIEEL